MISILCFILAVVAYTISQLAIQGKIRWNNDDRHSFWGVGSWLRKYAAAPAPDNWYYRFFKLEYKERFPGSATIFVMFTDGYHLSQAVFLILLCISIATHNLFFNWWIDAIIYRVIFGVVFTGAYKWLSK